MYMTKQLITILLKKIVNINLQKFILWPYYGLSFERWTPEKTYNCRLNLKSEFEIFKNNALNFQLAERITHIPIIYLSYTYIINTFI